MVYVLLGISFCLSPPPHYQWTWQLRKALVVVVVQWWGLFVSVL